SHEFHVLADSGEDAIAFCPASDYAANIEMAEALAPTAARPAASEVMRDVDTPKQTTCEAVAALLGIPLQKTVKLIAVMAEEKLTCLLIRGDHTLNEVKTAKLAGLAAFRFATEDEIRAHFNCPPGFLGPVGLDRGRIRVIADRTVAAMADFVCGANRPKYHLAGINWGRDLPEPDLVADLRNVVEGDPSPDGKGALGLCRGIEVGHIFKLGAKYSEALGATVLDELGQARTVIMGCYGIGVSRIVAAAIEQGNDERGIRFPQAIAPFELVIVPLGYQRNAQVRETADALYNQMVSAGIDVLLDDRDERPGVLLADMELIGISHRLVVSERGLKEGQLEYLARADAAASKIAQAGAAQFIEERIKACRS
ncbi:MAG: proline--tRNA ligase, partial [Hydrogenophilales bacterium CG15_BIG_FIL_POST_REV_8_21_14_020_62_31]